MRDSVTDIIIKAKSVIDIIEAVKDEVCNDLCKHKEECWQALDEGKDFYCPLDRL